MYREVFHQISFSDFNQSCGMQLDINNEWVILADSIKWGKWEKKYAKKFKSTKGNPAKPFRMVLGALLIQKRKGLSATFHSALFDLFQKEAECGGNK